MCTCPVCFFDKLQEPARDYNICECCGTEFGNDDEECTHTQLRDRWIAGGARWFFEKPPAFWNPWLQLSRAGVKLPYNTDVLFSASKHVLSIRILKKPFVVGAAA